MAVMHSMPRQQPLPGSVNTVRHFQLALATMLFSLPVGLGADLRQYAFYLLVFMVLSLAAFWWSRNNGSSLLAELKTRHPLLLLMFGCFLASALVSGSHVFLYEEDGFRRFMCGMRLLFYGVLVSYCFALARLYRFGGVSVVRIFHAYLYGVLLMELLFLLTAMQIGVTTAEAWGLEPPFGRHIRLVGMEVAVAVVVAVTLLLFSRQKPFLTVIQWFALLFCNAFLVWTGGRTSMALAFIIALMLSLLLLYYHWSVWRRVLLVMVALALSVPLSMPFSIYTWSGLQRGVDVSQIDTGMQSGPPQDAYAAADQLSSGRVEIWKAAWQAVETAPWFGHGPNAARFVIRAHGMVDQPHNAILQFLVEWGFVGTAFLLAFLAMLAWEGLTHLPVAIRHHDREYLLAASIAIVLGLTSMTDGIFFITQGLFTITTALAVFPFLRKTEPG